MAHPQNNKPADWPGKVRDGAIWSAASRTCPKSGRKGALKRFSDFQVAFVWCRFCDYEKRELKV